MVRNGWGKSGWVTLMSPQYQVIGCWYFIFILNLYLARQNGLGFPN